MPETAGQGSSVPGTIATWFGPPTLALSAGGETVLRAERPHQLLAYLAVRRRWVSRDELATVFWPDRSQADARRNLRKVLLLADRTAGVGGIERQGDRLRWAPESDLSRLEAASASDHHDEVLRLYRPPLMDGLETGLPPGGADWLIFERVRIEGLWRRSAAARIAELKDQPAALIATAEGLLQIDPFDELALTTLARARADAGDPAGGLRALQRHTERVTEQFGVEPSIHLRQLARSLQQALPGAPLEPSAPRRPATEASGLASRAPTPRFVGRRLELARLDALFAGADCRIVTVIGPGGVGKSSLARAALAGLQHRFDGRAWRVPLEDVDALAELPARVLAAIGQEASGGGATWSQVHRQLGALPALIVFDNTEQLAGFAEVVRALIDAVPALKVIVASRARLALADESLLPLDGLPLPDADETEPEVLRMNDAVRLFEERALASSPGFDLAAHAPGVVRLLHHVQGLPLAIELAAAWTRLLPVADITEEVERSLDLLVRSGDAQASPREHSLRSSFVLSWQRLAPAERTALAKLAHLPGAFDRVMAAQVGDAPLPILATLADKSLLQADGAGRFSLHPLLRQFVVEASAGMVDAQDAGRRHARYLTQWLGRFAEVERRDRATVASIAQELPHLRAAWGRAAEVGDAEYVTRAAPLLLAYFDSHGAWIDGLGVMGAGAQAFEGTDAASQRALLAATLGLAQLQVRSARFVAGEASARRALAIATDLGDRSGVKMGVNVIGMSLYRQGRTLEARDCFARALRYAKEDDDRSRIPMLCSNLAIAESSLGHYEASAALYRESAELARAAGNRPSLAAALNNLSTLELALGHWRGALVSASEALAIYTENGQRSSRPLALMNIAEAHHQLGELEEAARGFESALVAARENGEPDGLFEALVGSARVAAEFDDPTWADRVRGRLTEAFAVAQETRSVEHHLKALLVHAQVLLRQGRTRRAVALGAWVLGHAEMDPVQARRWKQRLDSGGASPAAAEGDWPAGAVLADVVATVRGELAGAGPSLPAMPRAIDVSVR